MRVLGKVQLPHSMQLGVVNPEHRPFSGPFDVGLTMPVLDWRTGTISHLGSSIYTDRNWTDQQLVRAIAAKACECIVHETLEQILVNDTRPFNPHESHIKLTYTLGGFHFDFVDGV